MNQTVWMASLVTLHAHSHEPDSVKGVTGNTTHTFMNGSDSLFIKEVGHLKAMQSPPRPLHINILLQTLLHVHCHWHDHTHIHSWSIYHTHMGNWPRKPKWTLQSSCWIASPQNWLRLWSSVAWSVRQGNIVITAMIFSRKLWQAKDHRDHNNDLYRWWCAPDNRFTNVHSLKNHFPSVRSDQKLSTLQSTTYTTHILGREKNCHQATSKHANKEITKCRHNYSHFSISDRIWTTWKYRWNKVSQVKGLNTWNNY